MTGRHDIAFEAFGVRIRVLVHGRETFERALKVLPPSWRPCAPTGLNATFVLGPEDNEKLELMRDQGSLGRMSVDDAIEVLERELRALVALEAPELIFIHAGAVAHNGRVLILPGRTHAGKSTLVAALVRAGALYYSDEFAPVDEHGRVHPFAKPLSLRNDRMRQVDYAVEALGGLAGDETCPVGAVVFASYRPGAVWRPRKLSAGEAALQLIDNTVPAQTRPQQTLRVVTRSLDGAFVAQGQRGEAEPVAAWLIDQLERQADVGR